MIATVEKEDLTIADLVHRLGNIPIDRIMLKPAPGTATEKDVIRYLEAPRKRLCELIDGVLVEKPMGMLEGILGAWLSHMLWTFVESHDLGIVFGSDSPIRFQIGLVRLPDVGFISWDRIPNEEMPSDAIGKIIPDLAVEILSRSNTVAEIDLKLDHYFEAGVRLAWVIDPKSQTADVYTSRRRVKHLDANDELDGGKVLPGFKLSLAELFSVAKRKKRRGR
jgi:Uma2 family endonuclease